MRKLALLTMAGALFGASGAAAQSSVNASASITIPTVLEINVTNTTVGFPTPVLADFTTGSILSNTGSSSVSTRSNVVHDVEVVTAGGVTTMTYAGTQTPAPTKAASDLEWSTDGGSTWTGLSDTPADVLTALARGAHSNAASVDYRMLLDLATDAPGTYSLAFVYSVVAN